MEDNSLRQLRDEAEGAWSIRPQVACVEAPCFLSPFRPDMLADMFGIIETEDERTRFVFVHPRDYADFRKPDAQWEKVFTEEGRNQEFLDLGMRGYIWGALIIVSSSYDRGTIWVAGKTGWTSCKIDR